MEQAQDHVQWWASIIMVSDLTTIMNIHLEGRIFQTMMNSNAVSWTGYTVRTKSFYADGTSNLPGYWEKCVSVKGDYLEKE